MSAKSHGWDEGEQFSFPGMPWNITRTFHKGECGVLVGREDRHGDGKPRWHLSISCKSRYPTWEEIKDARYALLPLGTTFGMLLPPPGEYVNVHPNCFHLWELCEVCS